MICIPREVVRYVRAMTGARLQVEAGSVSYEHTATVCFGHLTGLPGYIDIGGVCGLLANVDHLLQQPEDCPIHPSVVDSSPVLLAHVC